MSLPLELTTQRLLLRPWRAEDRAPFAALNADPAVMEHFPATLSREESDAMADRIEADMETEGWGLWAVEVVGGPEAPEPFIGFVGLARHAYMPGVVEVGWRLARPHWGRGYAPEGATACLRHAFDEIGLDEVVSFTVAGNVNSQRVMQKLGMRHEPARDFDHPNIDPALHPHLVRHVVYVITASDPGTIPA